MRRLSSGFLFLLLAVSPPAVSPAAADYLLEVQSGGPGTVNPPGPIAVPAGGSQTFTFTPSGCNTVGEVTVDEVPVGSGITSYTFTNVQSDHLLYVPFVLPQTTTTLDVRPLQGQCALPETLTASVPNGNGGQVRFYRDGTVLATRTVANGVATYIAAPGFPAGSYDLSASYLGTSCSGSSDSPVVHYDVADSGPGMTLALTLDPARIYSGNDSHATATLRVGGTVGGNGQVTYFEDGIALGSSALGNGVSVFQWTQKEVGRYVITAVAHLGTCANDVASEPETLYIAPNDGTGGSTNTVLTADPDQVDTGGTTVLTATVSPAAATGLVHFVDVTNSVEIGARALVGGVAHLEYGPLSGTNRTLEAHYDGDGIYLASTSAPVLLVVGPKSPSTLVETASAPCVYTGDQVTFTAHVSPSGFTGLVQFADLETGTQWNAGLYNDQAVTTVPLAPVGVHHVVASFAGTTQYLPSADTVTVSVIERRDLFPGYSSYLTGAHPWSLAIADLDGDGAPDVVTANHDAGTVSTLRGRGDGSFDDAVDFGALAQPTAVAVADLDDDGHPDLVVCGSAGLVVLAGYGDGTFQPAVTHGSIGSDANGLAIADLNGDGRRDVVVSCGGGQVVVLLGNGDGTFQPQIDRGVPAVISVAVGDVDGDGRPDLLIDNDKYDPACPHCPQLGEVSVFLGNGDGTFGTHDGFRTGYGPAALALGNLNGDGRLDVVTPMFGLGGSGRTVGVLLGNGDGTYGNVTDYGNVGEYPHGGPRMAAIADFDRDGLPDLAVAGDASRVFVIHGLGDGRFTPQSDYNAGWPTSMYAIAAADLNGDAAPDLVVAGSGGSGVSVLLNGDDGPLAAPPAPEAIAASALTALVPNPARAASQVEYAIARAGHVRLDVADVTGRVVTTLFDGDRSPGRFRAVWGGTSRGARVPAGVYFVRLTTVDGTVARKVTRLQ